MKASYNWLRELVRGLDASPKEVAARLTGAGLEVEGISEYGEATDACVVARVTAVRPHPTKSGLRLVMVERGGGTQEVVCGAPNVPDPGGLVVLAPLGARLPAKNLVIARRAIGGVESEGMLCSEDELGLGDDHDGIIILPSSAGEPGGKLSKAIPSMRDTIFEIGLTPNRPDGLGHVGLAREIAALFDLAFVWPDPGPAPKAASQTTSDLVAISVADAERCPHYGAAGVVDVTIAPSPAWARHRLQSLGVRAISNVVDITNLVMLEFGHPMHAFDLDRVRGAKIHVRRAQQGERLATLDGVLRVLTDDDLVICDGDSPVALAGVMGGATSEIHAETKRVLFECAWFDPRGVRRSAKRQGLHTESSHRFERGVDPGDVVRVLDRAVALTASLAGGAATKGQIHVQGARVSDAPTPPRKRTVRLRGKRLSEILGIDIPFPKATSILSKLAFEVSVQGEEADVVVPTHRPDVSREVDLVEEVIRVHGIDSIPPVLPAIRASRDVGGREDLARRARAAAVSIGLSEAITYGFTSPTALEAIGAPKSSVILKNPLGEHTGVMRTSLLPGLLEAVKNARRHGERDVREFTIGAIFLPPPDASDTLPREEHRIAVVLAGDRPGWLAKAEPLDAWDAKGYAHALAKRLAGVEPVIVPAKREEAPPHLHPRGAGFVEIDGKRIGSFGPLHPGVVDALELDGEVLVVDLTLEPFMNGAALPHYAAIPRFPAATRDISLDVDATVLAGDVERLVREAAGALAERVEILTRYTGAPVPTGKASLTFHIVYRAPDRTLTDAEVDAAHANVQKTAQERVGATLRT